MSDIISLKTKQHSQSAEPAKRRKTEGHEIALAAAKAKNRKMTFELEDGRNFEAVNIQGFDRWTITIYKKEDGRPLTIFKHAITSFYEA